MTDSNHDGAEPVDDAAVPHPPTVDQVMERQSEEFPEQARTAMGRRSLTGEELAAVEAGGDAVEDPDDLLVEGPNSA